MRRLRFRNKHAIIFSLRIRTMTRRAEAQCLPLQARNGVTGHAFSAFFDAHFQ